MKSFIYIIIVIKKPSIIFFFIFLSIQSPNLYALEQLHWAFAYCCWQCKIDFSNSKNIATGRVLGFFTKTVRNSVKKDSCTLWAFKSSFNHERETDSKLWILYEVLIELSERGLTKFFFKFERHKNYEPFI